MLETKHLTVEDFLENYAPNIGFTPGRIQQFMQSALDDGKEFRINAAYEIFIIPLANLQKYFAPTPVEVEPEPEDEPIVEPAGPKPIEEIVAENIPKASENTVIRPKYMKRRFKRK